MTAKSRREEDEARIAREVASRAVRRLDAAEWVLLAGAGILAMAGGALAAALLGPALGVSFRRLWVLGSLVFFVVPGVVVFTRSKREERTWREKSRTDTNDGSHV